MIEKNLFITGTPKVGKTTLIKEVIVQYRDKVGGFYTEEIREGTKRGGFVIRTFNGQEGIMALKGLPSKYKVGKYGVDVKVIDEVAVPSLRRAIQEKELIVIDEIGSMEILSEQFRIALFECLNSPKKVLATIRYGSQPFTNDVKKFVSTKLVILKKENYTAIKTEVQKWLKKVLW